MTTILAQRQSYVEFENNEGLLEDPSTMLRISTGRSSEGDR